MGYKSDIQIAQECKMKKITEIAKMGKYGAKIRYFCILHKLTLQKQIKF